MTFKTNYISSTDAWFLSFTSLSIILSGGYFVYWLNVIFTNGVIQAENVEFYTTEVYRGLGTFWMDQYLFEWFWGLFSFIAIIYPIFELAFWLRTSTSTQSLRIANLFISSFVFILFAVYAFITLYELIFCADFNMCRSSDCEQKFDCSPNPNFVYRSIFLVFFLIEVLAYGFFAFTSLIEKGRDERVEDMVIRYGMKTYLQKKYKIEP